MHYKYNISNEPQQLKPQKSDFREIRYHNVTTSLSELFNNLVNGFMVTYNFKDNDNDIKTTLYPSERNTDNFHSTDFMLFDFDNCTIPPQQAIKELNQNHIYPAFVYTTYNHKNPDKTVEGRDNRYRICLTLDSTISTPDEYNYVYSLCCAKFKQINSELIADNQCSDCSRIFCGTTQTDNSFNKYFLEYSPVSVNRLKNEFGHIKKIPVKSVRKLKKENCDYTTYFNDEYLMKLCLGYHNEVKKIDIRNWFELIDIIERFKHLYIPRHTPITYNYSDREEHEFTTLKEPFYEVMLPKNNIKLIDGKHRRKWLWHWGCTRRLIKPDSTFDEILISLLADARHSISFNQDKPANVNKDGTIVEQILLTIDDIMEISKNVIDSNLEDLKQHKNLQPRFQKLIPIGYGEIKLKRGWQKRRQTLLTQKIVDELKYKGELNLFNLNCELLNNGMEQITAETFRKKYQPKQAKKNKPKPVKQPKTKKYDLVERYYNPNITAYRCFHIMIEAGEKISKRMVHIYYADMSKKISEKTCVNI